MFKSKKFWIIAVIVLVLAGGGYAVYTFWFTPQETVESAEEMQTGTVTVGDLSITAAGSGQLVASTDINLAFSSSGTLLGLAVEVGDKVKAGDVLAWIDDNAARQSAAAAEQQVMQAEQTLALAQAQAELALIQAQADYDTAQSALDDLLNWEPDESEIAMAEATLLSAQTTYRNALAKSQVDQTISSRISLDDAIANLSEAQASYADAMRADRDWEKDITTTRENAAAAVLKAQQNLEVAQASYSLNSINSTYADIQSAKANVTNAQSSLDDLQTPPDDAEITAAQIQVQQTSLALDQAKLNLTETDDGKTAATRDAELALEQAQLKFESAEAALDGTTMVAPFDGTVTAINASIGESVNGTVIVLADLNTPVVQFWVEESDMNSVAVDYPVNIIFEALPDYVYSGVIKRVDPELVTVGSTPAVQIWASLDTSQYPAQLLGNMNADVEIVAGEALNALLVPVQALRQMDDQYTVFVVKDDGELEMRMVEIGLMDYVNAEVKSGLERGEVVSLGDGSGSSSTTINSDIDTQQQMGGPQDGGFMPGMGGMP